MSVVLIVAVFAAIAALALITLTTFARHALITRAIFAINLIDSGVGAAMGIIIPLLPTRTPAYTWRPGPVPLAHDRWQELSLFDFFDIVLIEPLPSYYQHLVRGLGGAQSYMMERYGWGEYEDSTPSYAHVPVHTAVASGVHSMTSVYTVVVECLPSMEEVVNEPTMMHASWEQVRCQRVQTNSDWQAPACPVPTLAPVDVPLFSHPEVDEYEGMYAPRHSTWWDNREPGHLGYRACGYNHPSTPTTTTLRPTTITKAHECAAMWAHREQALLECAYQGRMADEHHAVLYGDWDMDERTPKGEAIDAFLIVAESIIGKSDAFYHRLNDEQLFAYQRNEISWADMSSRKSMLRAVRRGDLIAIVAKQREDDFDADIDNLVF